MGEILFRGKRIDNGEWIKGYLVESKSFYNKPGEYSFIVNEHPQGCFERDIYIEVIPKTVSQYTGLIDKNGTKIFDGDILKITNEDYDYKYITKVYYSNHTLCVDVEGQDYDYTAIGFADDIWDKECCKIEVIGNIHDNLELLDGVNK